MVKKSGFDVNSVSEKSPIGYFLEVYLEYPDELHELHKMKMNNFLSGKICFTLVIIQKIQSFLMRLTKMLAK